MSDRLLKESDVIRAIDKRVEELSNDPVFVRKKDTIYREDAIDAINLLARIPHDVASAYCASMAINAIRSVPSADRPSGEWIDKGWKGDWQFETDGRGNCWYEYECSECGFRNKGSKSNYCPSCGARMKGAEDA